MKLSKQLENGRKTIERILLRYSIDVAEDVVLQKDKHVARDMEQLQDYLNFLEPGKPVIDGTRCIRGARYAVCPNCDMLVFGKVTGSIADDAYCKHCAKPLTWKGVKRDEGIV